jgi:transcriptional regulator
MYVPDWFREESIPKLHALIRGFSFAPLVTQIDGSPFATHLPFLLDSERGALGTLRGHMARANPHWRSFSASAASLVIFQGPHACISPSWYEAQPAVPTWNYAVVHAYGTPTCVDEQTLNEILRATIAEFDGTDRSPVLPDEFFDKMSRGVVGFKMEITRLEGKYKLSQNRSAEDRRRVIAALLQSDGEGDQQTAEWMALAEPEPPRTP